MKHYFKKFLLYSSTCVVVCFVIFAFVILEAMEYYQKKRKHKHKFKLTKITIGAYDDIPVMKCNCQSYLVGTHVKTQEQFYEYINRFLN